MSEQRLAEIEARYRRSVAGDPYPFADIGYLLDLARGRQQAEQARDEMREDRQRAIEELYKLDTERAEQLSALTQALKDYGQHKPGCGPVRWTNGHRCTCGFDAALTGDKHND